MIKYGDQECFVEFKREWELPCHLPNTVNELQENRRPAIAVWTVLKVSAPLSKTVAKTKPFFFNKNNESFDCSVVGVQ